MSTAVSFRGDNGMASAVQRTMNKERRQYIVCNCQTRDVGRGAVRNGVGILRVCSGEWREMGPAKDQWSKELGGCFYTAEDRYVMPTGWPCIVVVTRNTFRKQYMHKHTGP